MEDWRNHFLQQLNGTEVKYILKFNLEPPREEIAEITYEEIQNRTKD